MNSWPIILMLFSTVVWNTVCPNSIPNIKLDDGKDKSLPPPPPSPPPPIINKCCPFDEHYEFDEEAEGGGRCVPTSPDEAHIFRMEKANTMVSDDGEFLIWQIEETTMVPDDDYETMSTSTMESEIDVPDNTNNETTFTEQVPDTTEFPTTTINLTDSKNVTFSKSHDNANKLPPIQFRLSIGTPNCSSTNIVRRIIYRSNLPQRNPRVKGDHQYDDIPNDNSASTELLISGGLIWKDEHNLLNARAKQNFCIDQVNETVYVALVCKPVCNDLVPCVRKCCNPSQVFDIVKEQCVSATHPWMPYLYTTSYDPLNKLDAKESRLRTRSDFHYTYFFPCQDLHVVHPKTDPSYKMYALVNGSLLTLSRGTRVIHPPETYCIDGTINHDIGGEEYVDGPDQEPVYYSGSELDQVAVICALPENLAEAETMAHLRWKFELFAAVELTTAFFLFLTAVVYLILWEQQNIHGWLQFAYVVSCLISFVCLAFAQLKSDEIHEHSPKLCEAMGSIIHFSFLAAFFWMTSMNFDLWWTFRYDVVGCSPLRPRSKIGEIRRFCMFALFSWGSSGLIAGTGLFLDYKYRDDPTSTIIRPHFGESYCYFDGKEAQLPYFYGPVGVLLLINLVFFFSTIYSLQKLQRDTKFATQQSSKQDKKKFLLFMKLFIVMGVLWIFEVISWATQVYTDQTSKTWHYVFLPTDLINGSQGILIFIIFTCKTNTCRQIEGQLKKFTHYLQENRDKGYGSGFRSHMKAVFVILFTSVTIPIVHLLRIILNYFARVCGRKVSGGTSGGRTLSNTTTVTSSTFDKSRKISDCSATTTISSSITGGGAGAECIFSGSSSNGSRNSIITNIEMDMTSLSLRA